MGQRILADKMAFDTEDVELRSLETDLHEIGDASSLGRGMPAGRYRRRDRALASEREMHAESRPQGEELAETLPPDLLSHWNRLPATKKQRILRRSYRIAHLEDENDPPDTRAEKNRFRHSSNEPARGRAYSEKPGRPDRLSNNRRWEEREDGKQVKGNLSGKHESSGVLTEKAGNGREGGKHRGRPGELGKGPLTGGLQPQIKKRAQPSSDLSDEGSKPGRENKRVEGPSKKIPFFRIPDTGREVIKTPGRNNFAEGTILDEPLPAAQSGKESAYRSITRHKGAGTKARNNRFISAFTNLVREDMRLTARIGSVQKRIRIEQSIGDMEEEISSDTPWIMTRQILHSAIRGSANAGAAIRKTVIGGAAALAHVFLPLLMVLLPVFFIAGILPGFVGSLAVEEDGTANGEMIVAYARQWIGVTKYILGAGREYETDWQDYTDCSGFVHGVFSHFGIEVGGWTGAMVNDGQLIDENSTQRALPGDMLLFYRGSISPDNTYHVAIYSGNGKMIHCTGSSANRSVETAGPGVTEGNVYNDGRLYQVRRIVTGGTYSYSKGGIGTGGHRVDPTRYTRKQLELIWAIVAQEDNGSYEGALAVISSAMNRTESSKWGYAGSNALEQLTAPGQYCYSNDTYWVPRLNGNVPNYVIKAVNDCLKYGIRNHNHTSFRSTKGKVTGNDAVQIGGNWFFDY